MTSATAAAAAELGAPTAITLSLAPVGGKGQLALVRSYEIPTDDPSYERLLNLSWTYDSAVSAAAFVAAGNQAQAQQLLDQLTALQNSDGSIDFAFNVANGAGVPLLRAGTIAWVGLAAASYDQTFKTSTYLKTETLAAEYLLSLQTANGLIRGGPDVKWVSTQHNLIAYAFLARLGSELQSSGEAAGAARYQAAAAQIGAAIEKNLLVQEAGGAWFRQGVEDEVQSLDVQALGALYLQGRGAVELGKLVLSHAQSAFAISGQSISLSSTPATYNMSYSSPGPFTGYEPYSGKEAPAVLWFEGTAEMRMASAAYAQDTKELDASMAQWEALTLKSSGAPLQANETITSIPYGVEYHVWPAAAPAAWVILSQSAPTLLSAALPAAPTLVTAWNKVRGGNLITTSPEGTVDMLVSGGERRVLAGSASAADYTITTNATLLSGDGYGIWLRANSDASTSYCLQLDHGFGQLVLRERQGESELTPLARANLPAGFVWYGQQHILSATIKGDTLTASVDGTRVMSVPDLATASAAAAKLSTSITVPVVPPQAGFYGLRAWGTALVHFQQVTVG